MTKWKVFDHLDASDSVPSKHVSALAEVGYVGVRKGTFDGQRTTWLSLTPKGRSSFASHVDALRAVIDVAR